MAIEHGKTTAEYRTMVDKDGDITNSLKANLRCMSSALHKEDFIPKAVVEEMAEVVGKTMGDKASQLTGLVADKVERDVRMFDKFCKILDNNEDPGMADILRQYCLGLQGTFYMIL